MMPRQKKYNEHINDHQLQLVQALTAEGRIVPAYEPEDLPHAVAEARKRASPAEDFQHNISFEGRSQPVSIPPPPMLKLVETAIQELLKSRK